MPEDSPITELLHAWKEGDQSALDELVSLVYANLRRMAGACIGREGEPSTLDPTALVHEAFLKMAGGRVDFQSRAHFLGSAARVMREILVDRARARKAGKRNAGARVPIEDDAVFMPERAALVVALDDALEDLQRQDPEKARLIELRYFGGLTAEESAELLGISVSKVNRQIRMAQAWLRRDLQTAMGSATNPSSESA